MKKLLAVTALFLAFGFNSTDAIAKEKEQECADFAWVAASNWCSNRDGGCSDYQYWVFTDIAYNECMN
ncbi:hypothetical protein [Haloflavibacter putidus]|uniref:Uncharacterized protein n=1 Tax=Haloflavibacter putidus TaxID=2576776 RepID=A0A507ZVR6_9FLAO|nr:hypothetical protein [Haloflavibacter putidus]TQD40691.1 hypothetical protein FKR84_01545 [Haloflavibacter putidus]